MTGLTMESLADKDAIRELLARCCFDLDNERFEEMAALFIPDGVWETAFGTGTSRAGIVAQARSLASAPRPRRIHLNGNIVIQLNEDTATVHSYWTLVQNSPSGPIIGSGGAYDDRLVKRDGQWFFAHRRIDRCISGDRVDALAR